MTKVDDKIHVDRTGEKAQLEWSTTPPNSKGIANDSGKGAAGNERKASQANDGINAGNRVDAAGGRNDGDRTNSADGANGGNHANTEARKAGSSAKPTDRSNAADKPKS